jgi:glycosyltransferase involved in cell wall biosynthesis
MKKNNPLVSIITPNFNGDKYLEETIKSVVNQTYKKIEYILIDGKSTDQSLKIIRKYRNYINIFESKKDKNIFHAVDKGIKKSSGEIIIWINSDDILHPNAAENVVKIFKSNPKINWINGICGYIKNNIKFFFIPYIYPKSIILSGKAHKKYWGYIQQESVSFKRSLYFKSGGLDIKKGSPGDYKLWQKFSKISNLNTYFIKIGYFRSHPGQLSAKKNKYEKFTGNISSKYDLNLKRLIYSLIMLPIIFYKTIKIK